MVLEVFDLWGKRERGYDAPRLALLWVLRRQLVCQCQCLCFCLALVSYPCSAFIISLCLVCSCTCLCAVAVGQIVLVVVRRTRCYSCVRFPRRRWRRAVGALGGALGLPLRLSARRLEAGGAQPLAGPSLPRGAGNVAAPHVGVPQLARGACPGAQALFGVLVGCARLAAMGVLTAGVGLEEAARELPQRRPAPAGGVEAAAHMGSLLGRTGSSPGGWWATALMDPRGRFVRAHMGSANGAQAAPRRRCRRSWAGAAAALL